MVKKALSGVIICLALIVTSVAQAQQRCEIPREARDIWHCEDGFVIGPEDVIIRLPIPETDPEALYHVGLEAAQREDWRVAIAYFTAAHQHAHLVPRYMYNLGLAHARAGHDLPAIAWFSAYLITDHETPNREAVWEEIARSEQRLRGAIERAWRAAENAAAAMPIQGDARWRAYLSLRDEAVRAGDMERARAMHEQANRYTPADFEPLPFDSLMPSASTRYSNWSTQLLFDAVYVGDPGVDELMKVYGDSSPDAFIQERQALREGDFRHRLIWGPYAPGFMHGPIDFGPSPIAWVASHGADAQLLGAYVEAHPNGGELNDLSLLAAQGEGRRVLEGVAAMTSDGFNGNYRQLTALSVGQVLLLRGDRAGAERALAHANGYAREGSWNHESLQLAALISAERGDVEGAIVMLEVKTFRRLSPWFTGDWRWAESGWYETRFDGTGLIAEYLRNRGRTGEAVALAARMDSMRRVAFLETFAGSEAEAALLAAADQQPVSPLRRRAIENAVVTALQMRGASHDPTLWLRRVQAADSAEGQFFDIAGAARELELSLRRIRFDYQRAGGTWGH